MFVIGNFLFHRWLNNFLGTIGAFEVYYNDIVLYSKLSKKILPKIKDIKSAVSLLEMKKRRTFTIRFENQRNWWFVLNF